MPNLASGINKQGDEGFKSVSLFNMISWDFPGGPVVKTLCSQCRGPGFDPWSGN